MDILDRLNKNIEAAQNGPYVGIKEQRESWKEAAHEIERLRKQVEAMQWRPIENMPYDEVVWCAESENPHVIWQEFWYDCDIEHFLKNTNAKFFCKSLPLPPSPEE